MSLSKRRSPSGKSQDFAKSFGSLDRPVRKQLCSQTRIESSNRLKIQLHRGNAGSNADSTGSKMRVDFSSSAEFLPQACFFCKSEIRFWTLFASSTTSPPPWSSKSIS